MAHKNDENFEIEHSMLWGRTETSFLRLSASEDIIFRSDSMILSLRANFVVKKNQGQGMPPLILEFPTHQNLGCVQIKW